MNRRAGFGLLVVCALVGLLVQACSSAPSVPQVASAKAKPTISVSDVKLIEPTSQGVPYRVEATIHHDTAGGQAGVTFRLRNNGAGQSPEFNGRVELKPGIALVAVGEIQAPPGDYTPQVEVQYPLP